MEKIVFLLIMAVATAGCNREKSNAYDEHAAKENFCSHLNAENIDQTIPIVNQFLSGLSAELNNEQQLQELTAWLKSCPCIIDAEVLTQPSSQTNPSMREIEVSFDENGTTKRFIMTISMEKPLKVTGYHEYMELKDDFCTFLNVDDIDKTIPFVDEFLSGLATQLDDEQQLQALVDWLKTQPCIIDAAIYGEINPTTSEIAIWFDEDGVTKDFILEVAMSHPLKAVAYHEYTIIPSWDYFLPNIWKWSPWLWIDYIPFEVIVLNNNEDLKEYIIGSANDRSDYPDIDFSKHSLLVVSGSTSNFDISDITGSLHQHGARYVLHIEISRNDYTTNRFENQWSFALMTEKLSDEISIETVISYSKYEGEDFYYVYDEKIYLQQRSDKIFLKLAPDVNMEQAQAIIYGDASLRLAFLYRYQHSGWEGCFLDLKEEGGVLETKDGRRIPSSTLESLRAREEVVYATYMHGTSLSTFTNEFVLMLKPITSYSQLEELAKKHDCLISGENLLQKTVFSLYVSSKSSAMQMANLFYETGLFEYSAPCTFHFNAIH